MMTLKSVTVYILSIYSCWRILVINTRLSNPCEVCVQGDLLDWCKSNKRGNSRSHMYRISDQVQVVLSFLWQKLELKLSWTICTSDIYQIPIIVLCIWTKLFMDVISIMMMYACMFVWYVADMLMSK